MMENEMVNIGTYKEITGAVIVIMVLLVAIFNIPYESVKFKGLCVDMRLLFTLVAAIVVGASAKIFGDFYGEVEWTTHVVNLFFAAAAASGIWSWIPTKGRKKVEEHITGIHRAIKGKNGG